MTWRILWWRIRQLWRMRGILFQECVDCRTPLLDGREHVRCEDCHAKWFEATRVVRLPNGTTFRVPHDVQVKYRVYNHTVELEDQVPPQSAIRTP